jgi:hypothetical protein
MKLTKKRLRQLIKEELTRVNEDAGPAPLRHDDPRKHLGQIYATSGELERRARELRQAAEASGNLEVAQFLKQLIQWLTMVRMQGSQFEQYGDASRWTWDWGA